MPKFVIFGQGRSGSTLLTELLNCSPRVWCDGEILGEHRVHVERHTRARRARQIGRAYGYKVKIYQLTADQGVDDVGGWLRQQERAGWKIISLRRYNVVRQVVSNIDADRQGRFHARGDEPPRAPLLIEPDVLLDYARRRTALGEEEDRALSLVSHQPVAYEDDLQTPEAQQATLDRLLDWLELPRVTARTSLRRTNPGRLDDLVENVIDLREAIASTPFASMWD